ncbi:hypothetical protein [Roseicyclus sediminis]|jgi:hypothetical protein|uniref:hypothetical protein n=1 Tax=Roseicyclus sediminis TaxID=2980997 RepID=UPI0021D1C83C|nr:hypothetical protein [Roseibacterium sp. SDUM158016]
MILAVIGFGAVGLWFLLAGDGPARLVGLVLLALAGLFAFLLWVALTVERAPASVLPQSQETAHG